MIAHNLKRECTHGYSQKHVSVSLTSMHLKQQTTTTFSKICPLLQLLQVTSSTFQTGRASQNFSCAFHDYQAASKEPLCSPAPLFTATSSATIWNSPQFQAQQVNKPTQKCAATWLSASCLVLSNNRALSFIHRKKPEEHFNFSSCFKGSQC